MANKAAVVARPLGGLWRLFRSNPIILKELRGRMRGWRGTFNLAFYAGALSFFGILIYIGTYSSRLGSQYYSYTYGSTGNSVIRPVSVYYSSYGSDAGNQILLALIIGQLVLITFLSPAFSAGTLASEKERQTYDILLITLLRPRDIVLGKLFSTQAYLCLMIIAAMPVLSVVFLVGGVSLSQILIGLATCLLTTLMLGSLAVFWSAVSRTTGRAFRNAFWVMLVLFLAIPGIGLLADQVIRNVSYRYPVSGASYIPPEWLQGFTHLAYSFNPVVAVGYTYYLINSRTRDLFLYHNYYYDSSGNRIEGLALPMPWITYLVIAAIFSLLFIWGAIRRVKPLNAGVTGPKIKSGKKSQDREITTQVQE